MITLTTNANELARFDALQTATRSHRRQHGCHAYTFEDGPGLLAIARIDPAIRILELGTAIGYTACVLGTAIEHTRVDTVEGDPAHVALAREHIRNLGLDERVKVHSGDFFKVMAELDGVYDLAFFDGLGPTLRLINRLRNLLRPKGILVCGNLAHADRTEHQAITAEFEQSGRWQHIGSIEGGGTLAFRKIKPATSFQTA